MNLVGQKVRLSYVVLILLLLVSGVVSWRVFFKEYSQEDTVNIHHFPREIDTWTSVDLPMPEDVYLILETRNVFTRRYKTSEGKEVFLMLVYSQSNRKVSHPPEICYAGSGVTILSNEPTYMPIDSQGRIIKVNRLFVEQGGTQQVMYYWFKVGDTYTANYWKQQLLIVWKTLLGQPASSALLRISVTLDSEGPSGAIETLNEFSPLISPFFLQYLP